MLKYNTESSIYKQLLLTLQSILDISVYTIEKIVKFWWFTSGHIILQKKLIQLRQNSGKIFRVDHTYKIVKQLGAYDEEKKVWISFKCSLLQILDENGFVLAYEIVPNDSRELVGKLMQIIWLTPNRYIFEFNIKFILLEKSILMLFTQIILK